MNSNYIAENSSNVRNSRTVGSELAFVGETYCEWISRGMKVFFEPNVSLLPALQESRGLLFGVVTRVYACLWLRSVV